MNKEPLVVAASTQQQQQQQQQQTPMHLRSVSEPVSMIPLDPNNVPNNDPNSLPYGWQQARTVDGRIYYIKYWSFLHSRQLGSRKFDKNLIFIRLFKSFYSIKPLIK